MLSDNAAAVLGMVSLGARSGYAVRRAAELSLRFFWALGPPQIYAELARLEEAGLLEGADEPQGRRPRRVYEVTPSGRAALRAWAAKSEPASLELRDPEILRLFFADAVPAAQRRRQLERVRDRSQETLGVLRDRVLPAAEATGHEGPRRAADFGVAFHEFIVGWCEERLADG